MYNLYIVYSNLTCTRSGTHVKNRCPAHLRRSAESARVSLAIRSRSVRVPSALRLRSVSAPLAFCLCSACVPSALRLQLIGLNGQPRVFITKMNAAGDIPSIIVDFTNFSEYVYIYRPRTRTFRILHLYLAEV